MTSLTLRQIVLDHLICRTALNPDLISSLQASIACSGTAWTTASQQRSLGTHSLTTWPRARRTARLMPRGRLVLHSCASRPRRGADLQQHIFLLDLPHSSVQAQKGPRTCSSAEPRWPQQAPRGGPLAAPFWPQACQPTSPVLRLSGRPWICAPPTAKTCATRPQEAMLRCARPHCVADLPGEALCFEIAWKRREVADCLGCAWWRGWRPGIEAGVHALPCSAWYI